MTRSKSYLWLILLLLLFGCEEKSTKPKLNNTELSFHTHLILAEDINNEVIAITESTIVIPNTGKLKYLGVEDIILTGPNNFSEKGLLLKIINKQTSAEEIILTTKKAKLTEAFYNLHLNKKLLLTPEDIQSIDMQNSTFSTDNGKFNFYIDYVFADNDGNVETTNDQARLSGDLDFQLALNIAIDINENMLNKYKISWEINKNIALNLTTGNVFQGEISEIPVSVAQINFSPQLYIVENIPQIITPQLQISVGLDGEIMANLTTEINYSETSTNGLSYETGIWNNLTSYNNDFSLAPITEKNKSDFNQTVVAKLDFTLYDSETSSISVNNNIAYASNINTSTGSIHNMNSTITVSQTSINDFKMSDITNNIGDKQSEIEVYNRLENENHYPIITPPDMVYVPSGSFIMGNTRNIDVPQVIPPHQVFVNAFYICTHEVTQPEYIAIMNENPSEFPGENHPVHGVSWFKALEYCNRLSISESRTPCYIYHGYGTNPDEWPQGWNSLGNQDNISCDFQGTGYRLPTEAEWEYAARGATNDPDYLFSGSNYIQNVVSFGVSESDSSTGSTWLIDYSPVCSKSPNSLGIYDMSGSAHEWCWDKYADSTDESQINPTGPEYGDTRIARGGAPDYIMQCNNVFYRLPMTLTYFDKEGIRVVLTAQ